MGNSTVTKLLILLSVLIGLMFVAVLCYRVSVVFIDRSGILETANLRATEPPVTEAAPTTIDTPEPAVEAIPKEETPVPTPTTEAEAVDENPAPNPAPNTSTQDLTWDGLKIDVTDINYNAWPLIKAQNENNDPPLNGMDMLLVTVRVTNVEGIAEEPVSIRDSDFQIIGDNGAVYKPFQVSCGVVPDSLAGAVPLDGTMDGKICWQVPHDEDGFKLIYEPFGSPAVYFDLPQRADADWVPPDAPPALIQNKELTWDGLKIDIADINYNAWPLIKATNSNNDPPLEGMTMLLITVRVTNFDGTPEEAIRLWESDFKLIGNRNTVYETFEVSCGVTPDEINAVVAPGDSMDGNVCFQISNTEGDFQLIYEPFGSPAVYLDLPQRPLSK